MSNCEHPSNKWATSLCDCCGDPVQHCNQCQFFSSAMFCQPCAQGVLLQHAGLASNCCTPCCFFTCVSSYTGIVVYYISVFNLQRSLILHENIKEDLITTLVKVLFCFPCAMNQINNHLILTNKKFAVPKVSCNLSYWIGCIEKIALVEAVPQNDPHNKPPVQVVPQQKNTML